MNEPAAVTTVGQVLRDATARLAAVSDSPRLDAEVLAAFALGKSRGSLFAYDRDAIAEPARLRLLELIEARARHVPVASDRPRQRSLRRACVVGGEGLRRA